MTTEDSLPPTDLGSQQQPVPEHPSEQETPANNTPSQPGKGPLRALTSLRHRNYRLYLSGQMISLIGTWMQAIGQSWLILQLTHSGWQLGLVGALQALPILFFSLFGGIFADRWPKRLIVLVTQGAALLQALLLWILTVTGTIQIWHIYILALLLGFINCLYRPAVQSFAIEMVGPEDLPNAVALNSSLSQLTRIAGPSLGGMIIAVSSVSLLFLLNALSFLAVVVSLLLINSRKLYVQVSHHSPTSEQQKIWQSLQEGLAYVWHTPVVLLMTLVVGLVLLFGSNFGVVLPLLATDVLHVGAAGYGFLSAAMGIGALLSTLWLAWDNRRPTTRDVLTGSLAFCVLLAVFAASRIYPLSLVLIVSVSFAEMAFATQALTSLQTLVPDHLRGRATSVQVLFFDGSLPLGYLLTGWLAGLYGAPATLLISALLCLLVVGAGWLWRKSAEQDAAALTRV